MNLESYLLRIYRDIISADSVDLLNRPKNIWNMFVKNPYWASIVNDLTLAILDFEPVNTVYMYIWTVSSWHLIVYFVDSV